ncbi:hypothetical protein [Elizabethkingia sp. JS20170427COW]|uniref:hypothetical protein n=1 Tax=Elizabethkingia sp. JS20170427COW TaxID=2583851 RepID=UPI001110EA9C|nr:hypothetical protein [Elizabethkingia sp. JS20170427COW]QCX54227.1 hypothetical protein FGE20_10980 [Elizabethkingia sp. JS20170427COW]
MKKLVILLSLFALNSCVVSTATKIVKTTTKVAYKTVKGTVNGISWAVKKAEGKININQLNGDWKVVGVYKSSYDDILKNGKSENIYQATCEANDILSFKTKKDKYKPVHCSTTDADWEKYKFDFGKNPETKERENYLELNKSTYISIINVDDKSLILEGNLIPSYAFSGAKVYLLEKVK